MASNGGGVGAGAGEGNQLAGRGGRVGLGIGERVEDGPDRRIGLGTLPAYDFVRSASSESIRNILGTPIWCDPRYMIN